MRSRRLFLAASATVVVGILALAGCAADASPAATGTPTPSVRPAESASPAPSASATAPSPSASPTTPRALADCGSLVGVANGPQATARVHDLPVEAAASALGGLSCIHRDPLATLDAYPVAVVPEEVRSRYADGRCAGWGADGWACSLSREVNGIWMLAAQGSDRYDAEDLDAATRAELGSRLDALAADLQATTLPMPRTSSGDRWQDVSCPDLSGRVDFAPWQFSNLDGPQAGAPLETGATPAAEIQDANHALVECSWSGNGEWVDATFVPAGGDLLPEGDPVSVAGARSAVGRTDTGGPVPWRTVYATDGTNLLAVVAPDSPTATSDLAQLASRLFTALAVSR